ncbi:F0F1 ATP synthase subunit A [Patescibacteria group bacterium]|jgi:F-type H+-transporting ATPase subunit a|nr:F0F1 ATP synthase subunit A [Patescibacteria group bacterium]
MQTAYAASTESGLDIALSAEPVFYIGHVAITNTIITTWVVVVLIAITAFLVGQNLKKIPSRTQAFFELAVGGLLDYMESVLESRHLAKKYFPIVASLFIFILTANWFGLLPGITAITVATADGATKLFHPVNTDLNSTLALAIIAFLFIEAAGVSRLGFLKYASKFVNVRSAIGFVTGIIEMLSELARIVSFSFRLFGAMFAGKVLLLVVMFFVPFVLPVPVLLLELGVGLIQAAVFAILTLVFIKIAIAEPH